MSFIMNLSKGVNGMELRILHYFLTVASLGSVTKAAEALHITQPTLSRQLMQLEEELGVALFVRGKRKMLLTEEGLILKRRAEEMMALKQITENELKLKKNDMINIGCGLTKATTTLNIWMEGFMKEHPEVIFNIHNGNTHNVLENIENGLIDIGLVLDPVDLEKYSYIRLKEKERWGIIVSKQSPLSKKATIQPSDLCKMNLISSPRSELQKKLKSWCGSDYDKLNIVATSDLIVSTLHFIQQNVASAIVIEGAMDAIDKTDVCFIPFEPEMSSTSYIVFKKYQSFNLMISKFLDYIQKVLT